MVCEDKCTGVVCHGDELCRGLYVIKQVAIRVYSEWNNDHNTSLILRFSDFINSPLTPLRCVE